MIINGKGLLQAAPIKNMLTTKERAHGVSHGLAEVGYDICIKQHIMFEQRRSTGYVWQAFVDGSWASDSKFTIASSIEEFDMPPNLMATVKDKSTWARRGLSVFNTVIEPGWKGFLTLELVYHGNEPLYIPAGSGIAQVIFEEIAEPAQYEGKYQNQADQPVGAKKS